MTTKRYVCRWCHHTAATAMQYAQHWLVCRFVDKAAPPEVPWTLTATDREFLRGIRVGDEDAGSDDRGNT